MPVATALRWVGPYRILEKLGAGAMGEVYLAEDPRLHRRVALKTLADSAGSSPRAHQSLLQEARAAARVTHPNVAAVYDVVESDGVIHIVMEYVRGHTLAARLRQGPLLPANAVDIGIQLADGIAEAHALGIIHRDLKPSNIIVTPEGAAKVLDFGLARSPTTSPGTDSEQGGDREDASDPRVVVGTPPYVPPERFLGSPADARGDIYSLGVTLFEMLTGRRPFEGRDMSTLAVTALNDPTPRAKTFNASVSRGLDDLVAHAMARNPSERFGSAVELADALRHVRREMAEGPTESWQGSVFGIANARLRAWRRTWLSPRNALAAGVVLAVAAAAWYAGHSRRTGRPPTNNVEALADYTQARTFLSRPDVKENDDRAIALFQGAITKDPRFAEAHAGLARGYWRKFQGTREHSWSEKALLEATEALRLDPDDASAHGTLATIYQGTGKTAQALEEGHRAVALQPDSDEAHAWLGQVLFDQGSREAGIEELKKAIALKPNQWSSHYSLAVCYYDSGRYGEATSALRRVIELQPDLSWGPSMLGTVRLAAGDAAGAIEQYRKAIALGASTSGTYSNLGTAHYLRRDYSAAAEAYEEAARLAPTAPLKHASLGDVYARLGQPAKSKAAYERAVAVGRERLETDPKDARTLSQVAVVEAKLGRREEARRDADHAVATAPRLGDVAYRRAVTLALLGQHAESLTALEQAFGLGYSRKVASMDEDISGLRDRPGFQKLIGDAEATTRGGKP